MTKKKKKDQPADEQPQYPMPRPAINGQRFFIPIPPGTDPGGVIRQFLAGDGPMAPPPMMEGAPLPDDSFPIGSPLADRYPPPHPPANVRDRADMIAEDPGCDRSWFVPQSASTCTCGALDGIVTFVPVAKTEDKYRRKFTEPTLRMICLALISHTGKSMLLDFDTEAMKRLVNQLNEAIAYSESRR